jgi:hypothetical protein
MQPQAHEEARWDVAAYALGVLDVREVERCERHLAECPACAEELRLLLPASTLLADVNPADVPGTEQSRILDRVLGSVRIERRRETGRRRVLALAGAGVAVAVAALALFAGATWFAPSTETPPPIAVTFPTETGGERFTATDSESGVEAEVRLAATEWGTMVSLVLSSVTGPRECELLLVDKDGQVEVAGSWQVSEEGYGTTAHPEPLMLQAPSAIDRADLDHLQIHAKTPDGTTTVLVTVPL